MTPFTTQRKFLGITCFKHKAGFAFLQKVGAGRGATGPQPPDPSLQLPGSSSWSWASNDCKDQNELGGAQAMIRGRIWHLFEWILAPAVTPPPLQTHKVYPVTKKQKWSKRKKSENLNTDGGKNLGCYKGPQFNLIGNLEFGKIIYTLVRSLSLADSCLITVSSHSIYFV